MNSLDMIRNGVMTIVKDGDDRYLEIVTVDEYGYKAKYSERIPLSENYNGVEVAGRGLVARLSREIAFYGYNWDETKAEVLNKALLIKDQVDTRDFTNYAGRK